MKLNNGYVLDVRPSQNNQEIHATNAMALGHSVEYGGSTGRTGHVRYADASQNAGRNAARDVQLVGDMP